MIITLGTWYLNRNIWQIELSVTILKMCGYHPEFIFERRMS